jgi:hypothetical protein
LVHLKELFDIVNLLVFEQLRDALRVEVVKAERHNGTLCGESLQIVMTFNFVGLQILQILLEWLSEPVLQVWSQQVVDAQDEPQV